MEMLEEVILSFDRWNRPWELYGYVLNDDRLNEEEQELFKEIWMKAGDGRLWDQPDLEAGCKAACDRVRNNYQLPDQVAGCIVRALSYQWK